jgi:uncharacterized membrane protein
MFKFTITIILILFVSYFFYNSNTKSKKEKQETKNIINNLNIKTPNEQRKFNSSLHKVRSLQYPTRRTETKIKIQRTQENIELSDKLKEEGDFSEPVSIYNEETQNSYLKSNNIKKGKIRND